MSKRVPVNKGDPCQQGCPITFFSQISIQRLNELNHLKELTLAISGSSHTTFQIGFRPNYSRFYVVILQFFEHLKSWIYVPKLWSKNNSNSVGNLSRSSYESSLKSPKWVLSRGWVRLAAELVFGWQKFVGPLIDRPTYWHSLNGQVFLSFACSTPNMISFSGIELLRSDYIRWNWRGLTTSGWTKVGHF